MRDDQAAPVIAREFLENLGISVPYEAFSFYTEGHQICFNLHIMDEVGSRIIIKEEVEFANLNDAQVAALKAADCYGESGWELE